MLWQGTEEAAQVDVGAALAATAMFWHGLATGEVNVELSAGLKVTTAFEGHMAGQCVPSGVLEEASPRTTVPLHGLVLKIIGDDSNGALQEEIVAERMCRCGGSAIWACPVGWLA
jgi:hypothetical protein